MPAVRLSQLGVPIEPRKYKAIPGESKLVAHSNSSIHHSSRAMAYPSNKQVLFRFDGEDDPFRLDLPGRPGSDNEWVVEIPVIIQFLQDELPRPLPSAISISGRDHFRGGIFYRIAKFDPVSGGLTPVGSDCRLWPLEDVIIKLKISSEQASAAPANAQPDLPANLGPANPAGIASVDAPAPSEDTRTIGELSRRLQRALGNGHPPSSSSSRSTRSVSTNSADQGEWNADQVLQLERLYCIEPGEPRAVGSKALMSLFRFIESMDTGSFTSETLDTAPPKLPSCQKETLRKLFRLAQYLVHAVYDKPEMAGTLRRPFKSISNWDTVAAEWARGAEGHKHWRLGRPYRLKL